MALSPCPLVSSSSRGAHSFDWFLEFLLPFIHSAILPPRNAASHSPFPSWGTSFWGRLGAFPLTSGSRSYRARLPGCFDHNNSCGGNFRVVWGCVVVLVAFPPPGANLCRRGGQLISPTLGALGGLRWGSPPGGLGITWARGRRNAGGNIAITGGCAITSAGKQIRLEARDVCLLSECESAAGEFPVYNLLTRRGKRKTCNAPQRRCRHPPDRSTKNASNE